MIAPTSVVQNWTAESGRFAPDLHAVTVTEKALEVLGPHVVTLAETEGLPAHAESVRLRWPR